MWQWRMLRNDLIYSATHTLEKLFLHLSLSLKSNWSSINLLPISAETNGLKKVPCHPPYRHNNISKNIEIAWLKFHKLFHVFGDNANILPFFCPQTRCCHPVVVLWIVFIFYPLPLVGGSIYHSLHHRKEGSISQPHRIEIYFLLATSCPAAAEECKWGWWVMSVGNR